MAKNVLKEIAVNLSIFLLGGCICFAGEVEWQDIGTAIQDVRSVLLTPDNPNIIFIGSNQGVFKTEDAGQTWKNVLSVRGQNHVVNFLLFGQRDKNCLYAAGGNGLFYSDNQGKNWNRMFRGKDYLENECTTLGVLSSGIYLGTKAGLFVSKDNGRFWHKEAGKIGKSHILAIAYDLKEPNYIYIACVDGVFKTQDAGKSWERIFITHPVENDNDKDEANDDQDKEELFSDIRYISIDPNNSNYVYIATGKGIYKSQDRGKTWDLLTDYGLLNRDVKFLLISLKSTIYAVTKSGVFIFGNDRWRELSLDLVSEDIRFLAQDNSGNLYAACSNGLFKASLNKIEDNKDNIALFYFNNEPSIYEVQRAAIEYAEVDPEKIKQWRSQAAKKALLPQVSVGIDRNTTDLWHWEGGSTTKIEDDILRRGRDCIDWDVTVNWDLSELIWSDDQTSIDVRSRLMVELRDDILDEITKLYFERIRTKMELDNVSIEDRKKRFDNELKLQELTASIDALTGGYFSQQIKENKEDS